MPVCGVDDTSFPAPGPVTRVLAERYADIIAAYLAQHRVQ
jgi:hypothetical protein